MVTADVKASYEAMRTRVTSVAALHRRCALLEGAGCVIWRIGLPMPLITLIQYAAGLPFYIRMFAIPTAVAGLCVWGWRLVARPLVERYSITRAALLVEAARPELSTRVVSALEIFADLERPKPRFDAGLVRAVVIHAQESTKNEDFRKVVDVRPARKQLAIGAAVVLMWVFALSADPQGMSRALWSFATAWVELRDVAQRLTGAKIVVEPLELRAYLVGSSVTLRARQDGFHNSTMTALVREKETPEWKASELSVSADGRVEFTVKNAARTFECYFVSGKVESEKITVIITERPRIAMMTIEYELPDYVRRAPIVQPRSDGNLKALYGASVIITIEANKPLKSAHLTGSFVAEKENFNVAGAFAKHVIRLESEKWLKDSAPEIHETYKLSLKDEYGYSNEDAKHSYELVIVKDQAPRISFVGLPHRSPADEPHVLATNLGSVSIVVKASDDCGVNKITLRYRIEDLDNGSEKKKETKEHVFLLPRADVPQLAMLRLSEIGANVGDRVVFSAEVEDAYNLEPDKGPHRAKTAAYRVAVVTEEDMFREAMYRNEWQTQWYESLQVATLAKRELPERMSPENEPAVKAAVKLLDASQVGDGVSGSDQQLVQDYFDSLNVIRTDGK